MSTPNRFSARAMSRARADVLAAVWLMAGLLPTAALAQQPLGVAALPAQVPTEVVKRLDLGLSVYQGYDLTMGYDTRPGLPVDPRLRQDTGFSSLNTSLSFSRNSFRTNFAMFGSANVRYYSLIPDQVPIDTYGGLNVSRQLTERIRVSARGSAGYSPYYSFSEFLPPTTSTDFVPPGSDQHGALLDTLTSNASAGLAWALGRHTGLDVGYAVDRGRSSNQAYHAVTQSAHGGVRHQPTRYSDVRLGYVFREALTGVGTEPYRIHSLDTGFGYRRPLSFSRHTIAGFNVGSTIVTQGGGAGVRYCRERVDYAAVRAAVGGCRQLFP